MMAGAPGKDENRRGREIQSSRPLHNFTLPSQLKWGHQRQLRCFKSSPYRLNSDNSAPSSDQRRRGGSRMIKDNSPIPNSGDANEIETVRQKLLSDLKVEADQLKLPIIDNKDDDNKNKANAAVAAAAGEKKPSEEELPWNLRTRRATGKAIIENGNAGRSSPLKRQLKGLKGLATAAAAAAADKKEAGGCDEQQSLRPKFSLTLSKEEIEADFLLMAGAKPPKRPKKRAKNVRKKLYALVPGGWLTEVIPENYNVSDPTEPKSEK